MQNFVKDTWFVLSMLLKFPYSSECEYKMTYTYNNVHAVQCDSTHFFHF